MKKTRHYHSSNLSFIDMLFNVALSVTLLFILSFMIINPPEQKKKDIEAKADVIVVLTWPDDSPHDIDLWLLTPDGAKIGYSNRETQYANLERDDLGIVNDQVKNENGEVVVLRSNREVISIRGRLEGRYVVDVFFYGRHKDQTKPDPSVDDGPIKVKVELLQINPSYKIFVSKELILESVREDKTAFAFTLTADDIQNIEIDINEPFVITDGFGGLPHVPGTFP